jgi:hypothetical protein
MPESRADVVTNHAARYMTQLARHWAHKFETRREPGDAEIVLPAGLCRMHAEPRRLEVGVEISDAEALPRLEEVVAKHLARFAFREPNLRFDWVRRAG